MTALVSLVLRLAIGHDASASLHVHRSVFHHCGAQYDAAIHGSIGREIAHPAGVGPACFRLQLGDDLARPDLGRTAYRARRKACEQGIESILALGQLAHDIADDVHHVAVTLDGETVRDGHAVGTCHAAHVVAAQIEQHQVFGALLGIGKQAQLVGPVLAFACPARAGSGNGPNGNFTIAHAHQYLGAGADDGKSGQIQEVEKGRWVHPAKGAVQRDGRQREGACEALRQDHLEDIAGGDVVLRLQYDAFVIGGIHYRFQRKIGRVCQTLRLGHGFAQLAQGFVDTIGGAGDHVCRFAGARPQWSDHEQTIGQPVEYQHQRGPGEQHVRQVKRALRRARQGLYQADGLVTEIADQAGEGRGKAFGHVDPAGIGQGAQLRHGIALQRLERLPVVAPLAIDLSFRARCAEQEIGIQAQQAVTPANLAALHRFQEEVTAPRLDQLESCTDRGFGIGHDAPPDEGVASFVQRTLRSL